MRRTLRREAGTIARRILRVLRPTVAPSTYEVAYVATELRTFRAGRVMVAVPALDRPVKTKGLAPKTRKAFEASAKRGRA